LAASLGSTEAQAALRKIGVDRPPPTGILVIDDKARNTQGAQRGDAEAAMKLWQHYDFGEKKYVEEAHWKSRYDELRQRAHRRK
jgi:hypothetical protein